MREQPVGRRRAPPDDAEPRQDRRVVLGHRQVRDEADPVGPARVEERIADELAAAAIATSPSGQRHAPHDDVRRAMTSITAMPWRTPKLMKLRGNISHEPIDTSTAQPAICAQRRQKRCQRLLLRRSDRLAGADAGHEQGDDAGALHGPERIDVEVLADEAEVVEVEAEVERRHPDDGDAAQRVEAIEARRGARLAAAVVPVMPPSCRPSRAPPPARSASCRSGARRRSGRPASAATSGHAAPASAGRIATWANAAATRRRRVKRRRQSAS